ncbi:MAG: hypothetical protein KJZ87_14120 [Thermoguttaceae bacterium]|nr:hypothetical protein [Thermoguttaceae bacterium]
MKRARGFTLLEIFVASLLLAALLMVSLSMIAATTAHRQSVVRQQVALVEAANAMEHLWTLPWDELTAEHAGSLALSPEAMRSLADGALQVAVAESKGDLPGKRITVRIAWTPRSGLPAEQVGLVAWRFRPVDEAEETP